MKARWVYDIETFANLFTMCVRKVGSKEIFRFYIYEDDLHNTSTDLYYFLYDIRNSGDVLVGYNNIDFDNQIIEHIYENEVFNAREIYAFVQDVIIGCKDKFKLPYKQWTMQFKPMDLMAMNNWGIYGTSTSMKWIEFTTREQKISDMPYHHSTILEEKHIDEVLKYNDDDIIMTEKILVLCEQMIAMRNELVAKFNDPLIMNQPNSSIGEKIVLNAYCDHTGLDKKTVKKMHTKRKFINVADVILPFIEFEDPIFQEVLAEFNDLVLKADSKGVVNLKGAYKKEIKYQNMSVSYGLGGIHGCVPAGIYKSTDTHVIKSYDVTSMYPNIAIANRFFPEHLGPIFCDVYKYILDERKKFPKDVNLEMNLAYKEAANSVYGKSNASYNGFLKDPQYTVQTTVNGQLALTMLAERLSHLGEFLMFNTDGSEILIPRDKEDEYMAICDEWCKLTGIDLEHDEYETMWISHVNAYIAKYASKDKVKRKGSMCIYADYIGNWSKNPSALIIPEAINAYFLEGRDPYETITNWDNIHDFLFGIKGGSSFEYWTIKCEDDVMGEVDIHPERAFRFYISNTGKNLRKFWRRGKKALKMNNKPETVAGTLGMLVQPLQNIPDRKAQVFRRTSKGRGEKKVTTVVSRYPELNYDYYVREAWKWINTIENTKIEVDENTRKENNS